MNINKAYSIASTMFLTEALPCHETSMDWDDIHYFISCNLCDDYEDWDINDVWEYIATIGALILDAYQEGKRESI